MSSANFEGGKIVALTLMYITNNPDIALIAEKNGVQRIWIDLEILGKEERQKHMNTVKSHHTVDDIRKIAPILTNSEMLVRINPWNENSVQEINSVIDAGAEIIMLPMWKTTEEIKKFINTVDGRVKTTLLLETREAVLCLDDVLELPGIDEIHIGLNDLHLSYGCTFMFELLTDGLIEHICKKIAEKGLPYGFGGIARLGAGTIPAEQIIIEHYRLGSTRAILSRTFCDSEHISDINEIEQIFRKNMKLLHSFENYIETISKPEVLYSENKREIAAAVADAVQKIKATRRIAG